MYTLLFVAVVSLAAPAPMIKERREPLTIAADWVLHWGPLGRTIYHLHLSQSNYGCLVYPRGYDVDGEPQEYWHWRVDWRWDGKHLTLREVWLSDVREERCVAEYKAIVTWDSRSGRYLCKIVSGSFVGTWYYLTPMRGRYATKP